MVIDGSAIVAFLRGDAHAERIEALLDDSPACHISAVTMVECRALLLARFGEEMLREFEKLVERAGIIIRPFDRVQSALAFNAYRRFGRGCGHPAQLSLTDCAAYALARSLDVPLLYTGQDFALTDVEPALVG
jgi:ribonuclease VapC